MEDPKECQECQPIRYRQVYDEYRRTSKWGSLDEFLRPETFEMRCKAVDTGYRVNKETSDVIYWDALHNVLSFKVFDRIRTIEETISGMITVDNPEFKQIWRPFIKEYFMSHVYLVYSEEVKEIEMLTLKKRAQEVGEDWHERMEKAYPDSNFRLLRRTNRDGKWEWDALLSGLNNISLSDQNEGFIPIRFSWNEGYFFLRLYHLFMQYEVQMQTFMRLFQVLHTAVIIKGNSRQVIDNKAQELLTGHVHISQETSDLKTGTSANTTELVKDMPYLINSYDIIQAQLNDELARIGLGGDDSAKCERITTGENFRSLKPTASYTQAIMLELENVSHRIKENLNQMVSFSESIQASASGIPLGKDNQAMGGKPKAPTNNNNNDKSN